MRSPLKIASIAAVALAAAIFVFAVRGKPREPRLYEKTLTAMGTLVTVAVYADDAASAGAAINDAFGVIGALEKKISRFDLESDVSRVNASEPGAPVAVCADTIACLSRSLDIAEKTGGAFDPTVGPLVALWSRARKSGVIPGRDDIENARRYVSYRDVAVDSSARTVTPLKAGVSLDLSSVGKSYIVNKAADALRARGITSGYVNGGGDIAFIGSNADGRPWRVGVADPRRENQCAAALLVSDRGVVTSGDYNQYASIAGKRYSHIIDARTGWPADGPASVTIVARTAEAAAGWSTALSVIGRDGARAAEAAGVDYLMLFVEGQDLRKVESPGMAAYEREER